MKKFNRQISLISLLFLLPITTFSAIQVDTFSRTLGVGNLTTADGLIAGTLANNGTTSAQPNFVDHLESGPAGHFTNNLAIPGNYVDNFALHATCQLDIAVAGVYTFGTSNDDGARLRIDGVGVIVDNGIHAVMDFINTQTLTAGLHNLDLVYFENAGGGSIELFAASGTFATFDASMRLVGDTANGGLICNTGAPQVDVSITNSDGVTSATPGTSVSYNIVASNAGPNNDPSVQVADTFPTGLTCSYTSVSAGGATGNTAAGSGNLAETLNMPSGSSVTYTATCNIPSNATGTLSNTATITPSITDPIVGNNTATDNDTVLAPMADLSIAMMSPVNVTTPGPITYNVDVTNAGPSDAANVVVNDVLNVSSFSAVTVGCIEDPNGYPNCSLGTLTSGGTSSYSITLTVGSVNGSVVNNVSVSSNALDPTPANNAAANSTTGILKVIPSLNELGLILLIILLITLGVFSIPKKVNKL